MNWLEILGTAVGVVYLWLEYRANAWLWVASIVMPAIYLAVYYEAGLYADFGISIYYIIASVYGLWCWGRSGRGADDESDGLPITHLPAGYYVPLVAVLVIVFVLIGYVLSEFTDSTVPWADAFTTSLSIVAMWLLARKYVEQWLVWIAADVACAVLYVYKDLWFTGALYMAYAVIAVLGYRKWRHMMINQN
ncbi:MAG: nicotinamide riboside transporter PnuC [Paramuribaculum sp.]|nr:nicotinamide riboside transporter PnuC [Paramuribaculum sp.]